MIIIIVVLFLGHFTAGHLIDQDFEDGNLGSWTDDSQGIAHWTAKDPAILFEHRSVNWSSSSQFAWVFGAHVDFNPAVLRSPEFQAVPDDQVSFSFWVRSRFPKGNNLQVIHQVFYQPKSAEINFKINAQLVMSVMNVETILADLSSYSKVDNIDWMAKTVLIPVTRPTNLSVSISNSQIDIHIRSSQI